MALRKMRARMNDLCTLGSAVGDNKVRTYSAI